MHKPKQNEFLKNTLKFLKVARSYQICDTFANVHNADSIAQISKLAHFSVQRKLHTFCAMQPNAVSVVQNNMLSVKGFYFICTS